MEEEGKEGGGGGGRTMKRWEVEGGAEGKRRKIDRGRRWKGKTKEVRGGAKGGGTE